MSNDFSWAQICILHNNGYAVIGHGYQFTSTSLNPPKLKPTVPTVDMRGVEITKWQKVMRDYSNYADIEDLEFLIEDLEALK